MSNNLSVKLLNGDMNAGDNVLIDVDEKGDLLIKKN
ncbi:MAG: hypothetical protein Q8S84_03970 [bacterium]|nr:hypothetical protein [bacterium]